MQMSTIKAGLYIDVFSLLKTNWDMLQIAASTNSIYGASYDITWGDNGPVHLLVAEAKLYLESRRNGKELSMLLRKACIRAVELKRDHCIGIGDREQFPAWIAIVVLTKLDAGYRATGILSRVKSTKEGEERKQKLALWVRSRDEKAKGSE